MVLAQHVDKVHDDDAAQVAQPELPRNRLRRFQVGLENGFVKVARTDKAAGIHVHRGQRFGLVNDQVATRLELDPPPQRPGDFFVDVEQVKNRPLARVKLDFGQRGGHELGGKSLQLFKLLAGIDANGLRSLRGHITQHALQ